MMHTLRSGIFTMLCLALCAFTNEPHKVGIVFVGDSITYGAGLSDREHTSPPVIASEMLGKDPSLRIVYSNQGRSGYTTVDFLPATAKSFPQVAEAAKNLQKEQAALVFSLMLGTNDSAEEGPNGSPIAPKNYIQNLQTITDSLLALFPESKIIVHQPIWYSENTYNGSRYLAAGLKRLQSYFPFIRQFVKDNRYLHPGHVFLGDQQAFDAFKKQPGALFQAEKGKQGTFYLHPNRQGAVLLADYWAKALKRML